ncbi:DUF4890 domain-containing protein [Arenibacter latericius]|uniref:DUF4890 domain-containing protein n=1 Tax=Arenibacter latericius TaxID=86104 RepID=UPI0004266361|nr:DUF4890 domain-containing protein [Arenibacter latericius]
MKKLIFTVLLMIGFTAFAQNDHRKGMMDMSPEQVATLQTKKMTLALGLNDAQQAQIQKLNVENATLRMEKMKEMRAKKESGEMKKLTSEERYALRNERLDHQIAQNQQLQKILTKDQFEKWESLKADRMHKRKGRSKGHKRNQRSKQ